MKKVISLFLVFCMMLSLLPVTALAAELDALSASETQGNTITADGRCSHHPEHDSSCGYAEALEPHECSHEHDSSCGYIEGDENSCTHEHNSSCGYQEGRAASPCTFQCEECREESILYSDAALSLTAESFYLNEDSGSHTVTLTRGGAISHAAYFTVVVYDNSANYGEDYCILYNNEPVTKLEGSTSVYNAFRDGGQSTSGIDFDMAVAVGAAESEASGEELPSISAAAILSQLDKLNAKVAVIPVGFAANESTVTLTIEVADDEEAEYEETFLMAVLDAEGEAIESAQQIFAIVDNENPGPSVTVAFDCDNEMELTDENDAVELQFRRSGDLATTTLVTLYVDGQIYGQVDFAPWQEVQTVDATLAGVHTLTYSDGTEIGGQVEVFDNRTATLSVAEGADPMLDAIPDEYAVIPTLRKIDNTTWLPDWARSGSYNNERTVVKMGDTSNNLFTTGGNWSKGKVTFFVDGQNIHEVSTSGNGTYVSTGYLFADSIEPYDFTGVESVESTVYVDGVDSEANIMLGVQTIVRETKNITADGTYTLTATLPDKYQGTKKVYYGNEDPEEYFCGGTNMFVPNGYKLNLRTYRFRISTDPNQVDPDKELTYYGGTTNGIWCIPKINGSKSVQYMTINSKDYSEKNATVDIVYESDNMYPAKLVGYKLVGNGNTSDVIPLTLDSNAEGSKANGTASTAHITFDKDFLKKYEATYCYKEDYNLDGEYWTFTIVPVYEKIPVSSITYRASDLGTIESANVGNDSSIGDRLVVQAGSKADGVELCGVWYQATDWQADKYIRQEISQTRYTENQPLFVVDLLYPIYTMEGIFSTDATRLMVTYMYGSDAHGVLQTTLNSNGEAVSPEQYVVGDYVSLIAKPEEGYLTRWKVKSLSEYYYGNVFNYQLDGHPDHNLIYVEFVTPEEISKENLTVETSTLTGTLSQAYVEARRNGSTSWIDMANTAITIYADQTYTAVTDENGNFTIENFTGVVSGTYSVSVPYNDSIGYTTFTYTPGETLELKMHQFPTGVPYPDNVIADVNGQNSNDNYLTLTSDGVVSAKARVYIPPKGYKVTGVKFYFVNPKLAVNGMTAAGTQTYDATPGEIDGDYQYWSIQIPDASKLSSGMHLYVEVLSDKTVYQTTKDGSTTEYTTSISTDLVDTGYYLTTANREDIFSVSYEIPSTPSLSQANWYNGQSSQLDIPIIGKLDFSLSSKTGGFFAQRSDAEGNTTLICGSSYLAYFGVGSISEKVDQKRKTSSALAYAEEQAGAANADVTAVSGFAKVSTPSQWSFAPAYLFQFTLSPKSDGSGTYLSRYEMALGVDANYVRNIPFSIYGVPFYVCLMFTTEAYFDVQAEFDEAKGMTPEKVSSNTLIKDPIKKLDALIAAPLMKFTVKGGVGYNAFLSLYLSASVNVPFVFSFIPSNYGGLDINAGANLSFTVAGGADLVLFSGELSQTAGPITLGNQTLQGQLELITQKYATAGTSTQSLRSAISSADWDEMLDEMTFAPMLRSTLRQAVLSAQSGTVASNVFKNTGVHLLKLNEDHILAFYLKDNKYEDTLNYLSVSYATSTDGGETWQESGYVSDNTQQPYTSLQFDVNLFDLGDRTLVTWSEANFDEVLKNLGENIDIQHLTPAQISKFMNAMNLKGRFFNKEGTPMGDAFTIAESSTVACGALDAVKNGDTVYVYYQRNIFPYDESDGDVTLTQLLSTDRTIAMARANVNEVNDVDGKSVWISSTVRATKNGTNQEYRITDVEPFVHDGVMGEILVLDRDGKLAEWNAETESWDPSNEDRQLYLRTYTFNEETGAPIPSALMAITDPKLCAQSPQVVSNDNYLHLIWNQDGQIVYITDFVATATDSKDVKEGAYVVVDADGIATVNSNTKGKYYANDIASDDNFHIGTTFSASMDNDGHVLLSWVATDTSSEELTDEVYGVVLETVTNAEAVRRAKSDADHNVSDSTVTGSSNIYELFAHGSPVVLTDEDSLIGALDSVFLSDQPDSSRFLLAFSKLDETTRELANSADIKAQQSVYESALEITSISAPEYPMPGSAMTVSATVANKGLGEATNVKVTASGVGTGADTTIDSILPGRSQTVELTIEVPKDFTQDTTLRVTAADLESTGTTTMDLYYGPYFQVKNMPSMSNAPGTSDYWTDTTVYNAGNAAGIPTLNYEVSIFASSDVLEKYSYQYSEQLAPGGTAVLSYVLRDTPVTTGETGTLSVLVETGDKDLDLYQCIQGQMPKLTPIVSKADLTDSSEPDEPDEPNVPDMPVFPTLPSGGNSSSKDDSDTESQKPTSVNFTDVASTDYCADAVQWAIQNGVTTGTSANTFSPELICDRAQTVTFLWRAAGCPEPESTEMPFTDVPANAYYYKAVLWAIEQGITTGISETLFGIGENCSRAQAVTFLWRAAGCPEPRRTEMPFTDVPADAYYYKAVLWAIEQGITTGSSATTFSPDENCTRAQIVTFLYRYAG